jgi:hypothetical protein
MTDSFKKAITALLDHLRVANVPTTREAAVEKH